MHGTTYTWMYPYSQAHIKCNALGKTQIIIVDSGKLAVVQTMSLTPCTVVIHISRMLVKHDDTKTMQRPQHYYRQTQLRIATNTLWHIVTPNQDCDE